MKVAVIINNQSGMTESDKTEELIKKAFDELNVQCEVFCIEGAEIQNQVKELITKKFDAIAAAGGDGTVSSVASVLSAGNVPLGVLPCGTLNHFAKDLGIPLDLNQAVKVIVAGNVVTVDIVQLNEIKFINNSSIGLYADTVKKRESEQKKFKSNKWVAMFSAIVHTFKKFSLYDVKIKVKQKEVKLYTPLAFIGNNKYNMGLSNPGGRDRTDEGILSLYITRCQTRFCLIKFFFFSLIKNLERNDEFEIYYTNEVNLNTRKKYIDVSVDGEVIRMHPPLSYKIIPKSLPVIVPISK